MKSVVNYGNIKTEEERKLSSAKHWLNVHKNRLSSSFKSVRETSEAKIKEIYAEYPELIPEAPTEQDTKSS